MRNSQVALSMPTLTAQVVTPHLTSVILRLWPVFESKRAVTVNTACSGAGQTSGSRSAGAAPFQKTEIICNAFLNN